MSQKSHRKTKKVSAKVSVRKSGKVVAKAQAQAVGKGKVVAVAKKHSKRPTKKQPKKHSKKQMCGGNGYSMAVDQDRVGGQTVRKRYTECPEGGVFAALSKLWQ